MPTPAPPPLRTRERRARWAAALGRFERLAQCAAALGRFECLARCAAALGRFECLARCAAARGRFERLVLCAVALILVSGCASTQFRRAGQMPEQPLCQTPTENLSALVLWGVQWRPDQKEPALREAAAKKGIEQFFADSSCFVNARVMQVVNDRPALEFAPQELRYLAAREQPGASRALFITVRELGPVLKVFGSLSLVEGGSEVVFDVRSFDVASGKPTSDFEAHWQRGGPWVIKGTGALDTDLRTALAATLRPRSIP